MKFSIKDFSSKCDQIRFLWIWSHLAKKSFMENFDFCAVFSFGGSTIIWQIELRNVFRIYPHIYDGASWVFDWALNVPLKLGY